MTQIIRHKNREKCVDETKHTKNIKLGKYHLDTVHEKRTVCHRELRNKRKYKLPLRCSMASTRVMLH